MREMWDKMMVKYLTYKSDEEGQTLVEYALLLALIAIVVIAILGVLGETVNNTFNDITSGLSSGS